MQANEPELFTSPSLLTTLSTRLIGYFTYVTDQIYFKPQAPGWTEPNQKDFNSKSVLYLKLRDDTTNIGKK